MSILITGGAGYIGSHTCIELLNLSYDIVVMDNFCNSSETTIKRIESITQKKLNFIQGDVRDQNLVQTILKKYQCQSVIHFAGLKSVGESANSPIMYYDTNVLSTISLLKAMQDCNVKKLIFSSSATVYGIPEQLPIPESHRLSAVNPYGKTKLVIEEMLRDLSHSDPSWNFLILRYFNPVGAHQSGVIGEDPRGKPNNLMPYIAEVADKKIEFLNVWGDDYDTPDGTGIRDYIHVIDIAIGHIKALEKINSFKCSAINLGTGLGYSVLEVIKAFEKVCHFDIPYDISPRRPGDVAACYANPDLAFKLLNWKSRFDLSTMCEDQWRWQKMKYSRL